MPTQLAIIEHRSPIQAQSLSIRAKGRVMYQECAAMSQNRDKFEVEPAKVQKTEVRQLITKACKVDWGRGTTASWTQSVGTGAMVFACPSLILIYWISLEKYNGSLTTTVRAVMSTGLPRMVWRCGPNSSVPATFGYAGWLLWQAALYSHLPGVECLGQYTPGGHRLKYTTNGLLAWALTHLLFLLAAVLGLLDPAIIANNWEGLLWAVNIYGLAMAAVAQVKGHVAPSYPEDRKISGTFLFRRLGDESLADLGQDRSPLTSSPVSNLIPVLASTLTSSSFTTDGLGLWHGR